MEKSATEPAESVTWRELTMHYGSNDDHLERVRNILNMMDRSIDAARARRENPGDRKPTMSQRSGANGVGSVGEQGKARLPTSIFDRNGPRLKARPKRSGDEGAA